MKQLVNALESMAVLVRHKALSTKILPAKKTKAKE